MNIKVYLPIINSKRHSDFLFPEQPRSPSVMSNRSLSIPRGEPEIHVIQLHKSNNGMGLSIVATKVSTQLVSTLWRGHSFPSWYIVFGVG